MSERRFCLAAFILTVLGPHDQVGATVTHDQTDSFGLFPFGALVGDQFGPSGDDSASNPLTLAVPFTFVGTEYRQIIVNSNGVLSFDDPFTSPSPWIFPQVSPPLIAPFWHDFDPRNGGNISYRQTSNPDQLQLVRQRFSSLDVAELANFSPGHLFLATWNRVPQYNRVTQVVNTLQVVLATDRVQTVAVFIYHDIQWGQGAQIGFNVGDGYTSFIYPDSRSDQTVHVDEYSNVGQPGVLVYCIDQIPLLKLSGVFPFGASANDLFGPSGDDSASKPLDLEVPFTFLGEEYRKIIVNSNGVLSFDSTFASCCPARKFPFSSPPLIAPFWHDFDPSHGGNISYRQTNDSRYLDLVHILLTTVDTDEFNSFLPMQLIIATWNQVPRFGSLTVVSNTFQVVLATNGIQTLALFIYHDIRWGEGVQIGFNAGDGFASFSFSPLEFHAYYGQTVYSNVGEPGVFIYPIHVLPDQPHSVTIESSEATSVNVYWIPPFVTPSPILYYKIYAHNLNKSTEDDISVNTTTNTTSFNITGLVPGTTYGLTVVAVYGDSEAGPENNFIKRQSGNSVIGSTAFTAPALTCSTPVSHNGLITVSWSYNHTGGLNLSNLSVSHAHLLEDQTTSCHNHISVSDITATSIVVPKLEIGFKYVFNITAENSVGSSSVFCGPIIHMIGQPTTPIFGELTRGPNGGEITVSVKMLASGIDNHSEVFWFVITPILDGAEKASTQHLVLHYQSGTFETIVIVGLEEGGSYRLKAKATNIFGTSHAATSSLVTAGHSSIMGSSGAVIIGAAGGGSLLLVIIILLLIIALIVALTRRGQSKTTVTNVESILMDRGHHLYTSSALRENNAETDFSEAVYEEPGTVERRVQNLPSRDIDITCKLEDCPAYGVV